jgi:hypothetical protein
MQQAAKEDKVGQTTPPGMLVLHFSWQIPHEWMCSTPFHPPRIVALCKGQTQVAKQARPAQLCPSLMHRLQRLGLLLDTGASGLDTSIPVSHKLWLQPNTPMQPALLSPGLPNRRSHQSHSIQS